MGGAEGGGEEVIDRVKWRSPVQRHERLTHLWYSALSSMGGRQDFMGCPDADMDFTCRGRVEDTDAPGEGEGDAAGTSGKLKETQLVLWSRLHHRPITGLLSPAVLPVLHGRQVAVSARPVVDVRVSASYALKHKQMMMSPSWSFDTKINPVKTM